MSDRGAFVDAVVIGAGPFGLGVSYHLQSLGVRHRVLSGERSRKAGALSAGITFG